MQHKTSILICAMDDGTLDIYVNGVHCYRNGTELQNPERLMDKTTRRQVDGLLVRAAFDIESIMQKETAKCSPAK